MAINEWQNDCGLVSRPKDYTLNLTLFVTSDTANCSDRNTV